MQKKQIFIRTNWINEVVHRYHYERWICQNQSNYVTDFLETEILKEVYFFAKEKEEQVHRNSVLESPNSIVEKALEYIHNNLFANFTIESLHKEIGTSASTLLRLFKKELGVTPYAYLQKRRLEEAHLLLKSGRYSVGEVAHLVGYEKQTSFSFAFKQQFNKNPSEISKGL